MTASNVLSHYERLGVTRQIIAKRVDLSKKNHNHSVMLLHGHTAIVRECLKAVASLELRIVHRSSSQVITGIITYAS